MKWILFIFLLSVDGNQIKTVEFNSQAACMEAANGAATSMMKSNKVGSASSVYCLPKG